MKAFEITHVVYDETSYFSLISAIITLFPIYILCMLTTLVIFKREFQSLFVLFGLLINELLNKILKQLFKHSRPEATQLLNSQYGMPSSHAQFMFFFAVSVTFMIHIRNKERLKNFTFFLACWVAFTRVHLAYHTVWQVIVGALFGCMFGCIWTHVIGKKFFEPKVIPFLKQFSIFKYFRDIKLIEDQFEFEYQRLSKQE